MAPIEPPMATRRNSMKKVTMGMLPLLEQSSKPLGRLNFRRNRMTGATTYTLVKF
jgi:hypothetical protein